MCWRICSTGVSKGLGGTDGDTYAVEVFEKKDLVLKALGTEFEEVGLRDGRLLVSEEVGMIRGPV
jgi:hypothetical protein